MSESKDVRTIERTYTLDELAGPVDERDVRHFYPGREPYGVPARAYCGAVGIPIRPRTDPDDRPNRRTCEVCYALAADSPHNRKARP